MKESKNNVITILQQDYFTHSQKKLLRLKKPQNFQSQVTELNKAESIYRSCRQAIEKKEDRFQNTLDFLLEGCQIIGWDWRYLYVNDSAARHGKTTKDNLLDRKITEAYPRIEKTEMFSVLKKCMNDRTSVSLENEFEYPDGEKRWFNMRIGPVPEGLFILSIDITERKEAERALLDITERYKALSERSMDCLYIHDFEGNFIDANHAVLDLLGYKKNEILYLSFFSILSEDQIPLAMKLLEEVKRIGFHKKSIEFKLKHKNGNSICVRIRASLVYKDGKPFAIQGIAMDITELKQMIEELRKSQKGLAEAQRIGKMGNWESDHRRNDLYWSDEIYRIFGLKPRQFGTKYKTFLTTVHPEDREQVDLAFKNPLLNKTPYGIAHRIIRPDGKVRYIQEQCENIYDEKGNPIRSIGTVQDITERVLAEIELKESLDKQKKALNGTIQAISAMVEVRDPYTAGHQRRVTELASAIAEEMRLTKDKTEGIRTTGIIHDIGKIAVPSEILSKPGRLTESEFAIIKSHPQVGFEILKNIEFPWPVAQIVYQHHERMDGSGYPQGLSGQEILLEARIIAVADVVEAMASHRPYRTALGIEPALEEISSGSGRLYDPEVVEACLRQFQLNKFKLE